MSNYILSYPHSGNTWLRYCIEYLTHRRTIGHEDFSISERKDNFLNVNLSMPPVAIKRHEFKDGEYSPKTDKMIFVIRNPSECIKHDQDVNKEFLKYYSLLMFYKDNYIYGKSAIIRYENLFNTQLKYVLYEIEDVFDLKFEETYLEDLLINMDTHKNHCMSIYRNETNKQGADLSGIPSIYFNDAIMSRYAPPNKPIVI